MYVCALRFHWPTNITDEKGVSDKKSNPSHQMFFTWGHEWLSM